MPQTQLRWHRGQSGELRAGPTPTGARFVVWQSNARMAELRDAMCWVYGTNVTGTTVVLGVRDYQAEAKAACEAIAHLTGAQLAEYKAHDDPAAWLVRVPRPEGR